MGRHWSAWTAERMNVDLADGSLVSVVIPMFQAGAWIMETLESVGS